jgi:hypothetical protein
VVSSLENSKGGHGLIPFIIRLSQGSVHAEFTGFSYRNYCTIHVFSLQHLQLVWVTFPLLHVTVDSQRFFIPISVAAAGEILMSVGLALVKRREKKILKAQLKQGLTLEHLKAMNGMKMAMLRGKNIFCSC